MRLVLVGEHQAEVVLLQQVQVCRHPVQHLLAARLLLQNTQGGPGSVSGPGVFCGSYFVEHMGMVPIRKEGGS